MPKNCAFTYQTHVYAPDVCGTGLDGDLLEPASASGSQARRFEAQHKKPTKKTPDWVSFLLAPQVGLEPTTLRLTAACSTD